MGCCGPSKEEFTGVAEVTGMSQKELVASYKAFKKEAGGKKVKLDKFTKLVASMNTNKGECLIHPAVPDSTAQKLNAFR